MAEQKGFLADFLGDFQTCLGATLGILVESPGKDKQFGNNSSSFKQSQKSRN